MFTDTETLRVRLQQLRLSGHSLADVLLMNADRLDADGGPLPRSITDDLNNYREQFFSLSSLFHPELDGLPASRFQSLIDMESELEHRDTARHATAIAREILQITPHDRQQMTGLDDVQSNAREVVATLGMHVPHEELTDFSTGRHVWCDLLRMIRQGDALADTEWTSLNTSIELSLGRSLAVAAARGRLKLPQPAQQRPDEATQYPSASVLFTTDEPVAVTTPMAETNHALPVLAEKVTPVAVPQAIRTEQLDPGPVVTATPIVAETLVAIQEVSSSPVSSKLEAGLRNSAVVRAVAKSQSEASLPRSLPMEALGEISEIASPTIARIDQILSSKFVPTTELATAGEVLTERPAASISPVLPAPTEAPVSIGEELTHSVFDDIEPISLQRKFTIPEPVPIALPISPSSAGRPTLKFGSSSSIFDDDAEDEDELIMERDDDSLPLRSSARALPAMVPAPSPLAERLLTQARFANATGPSASLATTILNGREEDRADLIPDLILHLMQEGRSGLAYHLSRGLESRGSAERSFVPSWLVRVWTFGQALVFPKGQLAGLLQDDLQNRTALALKDVSLDWRLALSLLVRASTLRPAIIAPATRAASVLRDFDLQDGSVQLYNYCSRIGSYGERIQGVFPGLFKLTSANLPYSDQLSTLRSDIARWKESAETVLLKSHIATPLFQKAAWSLRAGTSQRYPEAAFDWMNWQIAMQLGESLVAPVVDDRRTELARVKVHVEEISTKLTAPEIDDPRRPLSQPEIRAYLRQAITFAQRWISLHSGAAAGEAENYLPQAAVELRSEIQSRHELVINELRKFASEQTSFEVRMAVACLKSSVEEIRNLVDPNVATDSREADPRHLLHAELLKISDLRLASNWEPEVEWHTLEDEILTFLSQPQPDWTTALKMQMAKGNHPLAERILSLPVWSSEESSALQGVLTHDRVRQRTDFARELNEVQYLLKDSVHLDILKESERTGFETRLARLQRIVSADNDVSSGVIELERVREMLVKRRERETERIRNRLQRLSSPQAPDPDAVAPAVPPPVAPSPRSWVMDFDQ